VRFFYSLSFLPKVKCRGICRHGAVEGFSDASSGQFSPTSFEGELMSPKAHAALPMRRGPLCFTAADKKGSKENDRLSED
jgi:hypothetical protein